MNASTCPAPRRFDSSDTPHVAVSGWAAPFIRRGPGLPGLGPSRLMTPALLSILAVGIFVLFGALLWLCIVTQD